MSCCYRESSEIRYEYWSIWEHSIFVDTLRNWRITSVLLQVVLAFPIPDQQIPLGSWKSSLEILHVTRDITPNSYSYYRILVA